jgi:nucleoside-diphosphate-sugar epimerase
MILVTGATGTVGRPMVRELAAARSVATGHLVEAHASTVASGLPEELATGFCEILRRYSKGGITEQVSPAVRQLVGREPRTFDQFVRNHANAYQPTRV